MPRQMHTKKWQPRIRNGIDQRPDKLIPPQPEIRPPEGNDPRIRIATIHDGEPIRRAPGADENPLRSERVCGMRESDASGFTLDSDHLAARQHVAARGFDIGAERSGHLGEVDYSRGRGVECGQSAGMGLDLADLIGADAPQAGDPVGVAAALEFFQPRQFALVRRDD
jgi:hypothetical protein